ncbi:MAG: lipoate--protein ligase family protein [Rikenellaceae bacterium]|jgi:lipoate-protein ligase A|nr:lipoate--protein ligase family protein [Rikenellaceae bacterium]
MEIVVSSSTSPLFNLAAEQTLLTERKGEILFFYINAPSVILGRNQQPEAEADLAFCRDNDIAVLKRLSGGGAVYHDPGNLNYAFFRDRGAMSILDEPPLQQMVDALRSLGIDARAGERKEIFVGGRKVSGTAAHVTKTRELFHGTLLVESDLGMLQRALQGDPSRRGKCVASVPASVANLIEFLPEGTDVRSFTGMLLSYFLDFYDIDSIRKFPE